MAGKGYTIITDTTCDLPQQYYEANNITVVALTYMLDGVEYDGTFENSLKPALFYEKLRKGGIAKTSAVSPETMIRIFTNVLETGSDLFYLAFSSGLSSTYQSACIARNELAGKYPHQNIVCIDSLSASLGEGLLLDLALRKAKEGAAIEELAAYVEKMRLHVCHYFTVDDLHHLYRGGRVSRTTALFGTMLGIKPILHVDDQGHLIPIGKVRGRRQSLDALVSKMGSKIEGCENPYVFISHGDCLEDAKYVSAQVKSLYGIKTELIENIGPVIGSHSGPGTVALFFVGQSRTEKKAL